MYDFWGVFWVALFAYCIGLTFGFVVAALMAAGSKADVPFTGDQIHD